MTQSELLNVFISLKMGRSFSACFKINITLTKNSAEIQTFVLNYIVQKHVGDNETCMMCNHWIRQD